MYSITRLISGTSLAVLVAGCGSSPTPTAPTRTPGSRVEADGLGSYVVSGVISNGVGPIAGANVNAWIGYSCGASATPSVDPCRAGYSYMWAHGAVLTDASGAFQLKYLPDGVLWMQVYKVGYVQQTAAPQVFVHGDTTINVQLVAAGSVAASSCPASSASSRAVSGVVVETTATGTQPVANVGIDFEPLGDFPAATTNSDRNGQFLLCGLPQDLTVSLGAGLGSRVAYASVPPGRTTVQIVLP